MAKILTKSNLIKVSIWAVVAGIVFLLVDLLIRLLRYNTWSEIAIFKLLFYSVTIILLVQFHRFGRWILLVATYSIIILIIFILIAMPMAYTYSVFNLLAAIYLIVILLQKEAFDLFDLDIGIRKKEFLWTFAVSTILSFLFIALIIMIFSGKQ